MERHFLIPCQYFLGGISACYCGYSADFAIAAWTVLLFLLISISCVWILAFFLLKNLTTQLPSLDRGWAAMHAKLYLCLTHLDSILSCNQLQKVHVSYFQLILACYASPPFVFLLKISAEWGEWTCSASSVQAHLALCVFSVFWLAFAFNLAAKLSTAGCECKLNLHSHIADNISANIGKRGTSVMGN